MLFPLWSLHEGKSRESTNPWYIFMKMFIRKFDIQMGRFSIAGGKVFSPRGERKKAARCLDNGWLDFPRRNIATFSDIRIHFCPFYRALIGFAAVYLRCKGRWKFRKNRLSAWNAVKFVVLPMEGSRIAISGYLIHFLIKRYGNSVVTITNGTRTFRTFNSNTYL